MPKSKLNYVGQSHWCLMQEKFTAVDERMASLDSHLVEQVKQVLEQVGNM